MAVLATSSLYCCRGSCWRVVAAISRRQLCSRPRRAPAATAALSVIVSAIYCCCGSYGRRRIVGESMLLVSTPLWEPVRRWQRWWRLGLRCVVVWCGGVAAHGCMCVYYWYRSVGGFGVKCRLDWCGGLCRERLGLGLVGEGDGEKTNPPTRTVPVGIPRARERERVHGAAILLDCLLITLSLCMQLCLSAL